MSIPVVAFFNNKGGVGNTSLVYHLAWMFSDLNFGVLAADLDPQANLTSAFLADDFLECLWSEAAGPATVYQAVRPLIEGAGDVSAPEARAIDDFLALAPGDLSLTQFEDQLTDAWPCCLEGDVRSFRVLSAFWRVLQGAASQTGADVILMDLGPNMGAINRAALIAADHVIVPLAPDVFSIQGLENLGPKLREWRKGWKDRLNRRPSQCLDLPSGEMQPAGYVVQQNAVRLDRPVQAYNHWVRRIPEAYQRSVLGECGPMAATFDEDPNCLASVKNYRSLISMAQEARKPVFHLKAADGALGGHQAAVADARSCFERLANGIAERTFLQGS